MLRLTIPLLALAASTAQAQPLCDFQHECYDGVKPIPPPPETLPLRRLPTPPATRPTSPTCHLMTWRTSPMLPPRIIELCLMPAEREAEIRARMRELNAEELK
jgi:hypothetical protein